MTDMPMKSEISDDFLRKAYELGIKPKLIADKLGYHYTTICYRMRRLGLKSRHLVWTEEHDKQLIELWGTKLKQHEIAAMLGLTQQTISYHANRLRLPTRHKKTVLKKPK